MPSAAHIQELISGISFKKQADLVTPQTAPNIWCLRSTSRDVALPQPMWENDQQEVGKGDIWATQRFPTGLDCSYQWDGFLTSEAAAMLVCFGLGSFAETTVQTTGKQYVCNPLNQAVDGIDMLPATLVQAIRQGGSAVFDYAMLGMCLEEFSISVRSGLGRQNCTFRSRWVGTGNYVKPSGIVLPAATSEHNLNAMAASAITILTTDYKANTRFVSLDMSWKNNIRLDTGYYPGSGTKQLSGTDPLFGIRGRMRRGEPSVGLSFVAEFVNGSPELNNVLMGTEGSVQMTIGGAVIGAGPLGHSLDMLWPRVGMSGARISDTDGIVTVGVSCDVLKHTGTGKVFTATAINTQAGIGS